MFDMFRRGVLTDRRYALSVAVCGDRYVMFAICARNSLRRRTGHLRGEMVMMMVRLCGGLHGGRDNGDDAAGQGGRRTPRVAAAAGLRVGGLIGGWLPSILWGKR